MKFVHAVEQMTTAEERTHALKQDLMEYAAEEVNVSSLARSSPDIS